MLPQQILDRLIESAKAASRNAYCPYSRFRVGAAVLGSSGKIFAGCNIENASYGLTICAERSGLARAISDGETRLEAVVIYTPTAAPTAPCGACRQTLNEFGPNMPCICVCDGAGVLHLKLSELLPDAFGPNNLA